MDDTNKREYKITKAGLWYNVYRVRYYEGIEEKEWLQKTTYTLNRSHARIFYHLDDAISALQIAKAIWKKETPTTSTKKSESEEAREKTSWSEL